MDYPLHRPKEAEALKDWSNHLKEMADLSVGKLRLDWEKRFRASKREQVQNGKMTNDELTVSVNKIRDTIITPNMIETDDILKLYRVKKSGYYREVPESSEWKMWLDPRQTEEETGSPKKRKRTTKTRAGAAKPDPLCGPLCGFGGGFGTQ